MDQTQGTGPGIFITFEGGDGAGKTTHINFLAGCLRDLGYEFEFLNLTEYMTGKKRDILRGIRRINPKANLAKFLLSFRDTVRMVEYLDEITGEYYKNCGYHKIKHS